MIFKLSVLGLTLIITLICFYPLLKKYRIKDEHQKSSNQRAEFNKAFYFDRLREIEQDVEKGVLDDSGQLKTELQHRLLEDIPENERTNENSRGVVNKLWFVVSFVTLLFFACLIYIPVGSWHAQASLEQNSQNLTALLARLRNNQDEPLTDQEMQQVIIGLRLELQKQPENADNWWLMGQLAMATNNGRLALDSYDNAYRLQPNNLKFALAYAKILMFSQDKTDNEKGRMLINQVLRQDHSNPEALSLFALDNYQRGGYKMAITAWGLMLQFLPKDDQRRTVIERSIQNASELLTRQQAATKSLSKEQKITTENTSKESGEKVEQ